MLAIHKTNKFCFGIASEGQTEFDEIDNSYFEGLNEFLTEDSLPKYKYENDALIEADYKETNEYKEECGKQIDLETYQLIKKWCKDQGKCEEYYLRQSRSSNEFKAYNHEPGIKNLFL